MKAANSLTSATQNASFSSIINAPAMRSMIDKSVADPKRAARLVSTLISTVSASEQLRTCSPDSIVAAALNGEAMNLSLALGQYSIVPFGNVATFVMGYKGYIQLAIRTGLYRGIGALDVRDGEYKGKDKVTGLPCFEFISNDEERKQLSVVGYYAYFLLNNGYAHSVYWSRDEVLEHADRYAPAFSLEKYNKLLAGELPSSEVAKLSSPWYDTGRAQETMCRKTVIRALLNSGFAPLSIDMEMALDADKRFEDSNKNTPSGALVPAGVATNSSAGHYVPNTQSRSQTNAEPETANGTTAAKTAEDVQSSFFDER